MSDMKRCKEILFGFYTLNERKRPKAFPSRGSLLGTLIMIIKERRAHPLYSALLISISYCLIPI